LYTIDVLPEHQHFIRFSWT